MSKLRRGEKTPQEVEEVTKDQVEETTSEVVEDSKQEEITDNGQAEKIAELEKQLAEKDLVIKEQNETIAKLGEVATLGASNTGDVAVAVVPKAKLVKVKMLKDHDFIVGGRKIVGIKGNTIEVDLFTANKMAGRGIAVLVN